MQKNCKMKEWGNKRDEGEGREKKSLKSTSHGERCSAPGTRTTPSFILSDLPLRSTYFPFALFFLPSLLSAFPPSLPFCFIICDLAFMVL